MVRQNSTLHRDFELPTISKFMKDASERFFDIASNHPNPLLVEAVTYEPPPPNHFCSRPRNVLIDPPTISPSRLCCSGGFSLWESDRPVAGAWTVHNGFSPPSAPLSHGENYYKKSDSPIYIEHSAPTRWYQFV
ncbi:hypothetical protein EVAR_5177_1 [Eumeta japonica]|uniref:Uncharacterized protein n=1 Tax=Eumeta variegata TaxID=151549 RepID=A0A4C1V5E0_EUMVA|nr:hypothetical protein EVAR_5177_1 [Eumeta japonica]